jgi:hypothetical protein
VPEEDVDASQDPKGVHEAAQCPTETINGTLLPVETGEQMEARARYDTDEDPRHKADGEAPHITVRGAEPVERRKDKRDQRVRRHECPHQEAEQAGERAHGGARTRAKHDSCDDDGYHRESRDDGPHCGKRAERSEADHSFNSEKQSKLCQRKSSSSKRCLHNTPPYGLSVASLAQ